MFFPYFCFREQRSCVLSATPSPRLETWGGSTCDAATHTMTRGASSVGTSPGWICVAAGLSQTPVLHPPPSPHLTSPTTSCSVILTTTNTWQFEEQQVWPLTFLYSLYDIRIPAATSKIKKHFKSNWELRHWKRKKSNTLGQYLSIL